MNRSRSKKIIEMVKKPYDCNNERRVLRSGKSNTASEYQCTLFMQILTNSFFLL